MAEGTTSHLPDERLLALADGELPAAEEPAARAHLDECAACRERMGILLRTDTSFRAFHHEVLRRNHPLPPREWMDLAPRFDEIDRAQRPARAPRLAPAVRWLAAAACLVLAILVWREFREPARVSAAELLNRAVRRAEAPPAARRPLRVRARRVTFVRPAVLDPTVHSAPEAGERALRRLFEEAQYSWDEPLSVRSYVAWRKSLPSLSDEVRIHGPAAAPVDFEVRTTTAAGPLREATLTLRGADLYPLRGSWRFAGEEEAVEISEAAEDSPASGTEPAPAPPGESSGRRPPVAPALPTATPASQELRVVAGLHRIGADLGDPVEIERQGDRLLVGGSGFDENRRREIREAVKEIPGVETRFADDPAGPRERRRAAAGSARAPAAPSPELVERLGGSSSYERFVNEVLDTSDALMARAFALRNLADRFPPPVEAALPAADRNLLAEIRHRHSGELTTRFRHLRSVLSAALPELSATGGGPAAVGAADSWQSAARAVFAASQAVDAALNRLLAGTSPTRPAESAALASALRNLESVIPK